MPVQTKKTRMVTTKVVIKRWKDSEGFRRARLAPSHFSELMVERIPTLSGFFFPPNSLWWKRFWRHHQPESRPKSCRRFGVGHKGYDDKETLKTWRSPVQGFNIPLETLQILYHDECHWWMRKLSHDVSPDVCITSSQTRPDVLIMCHDESRGYSNEVLF